MKTSQPQKGHYIQQSIPHQYHSHQPSMTNHNNTYHMHANSVQNNNHLHSHTQTLINPSQSYSPRYYQSSPPQPYHNTQYRSPTATTTSQKSFSFRPSNISESASHSNQQQQQQHYNHSHQYRSNNHHRHQTQQQQSTRTRAPSAHQQPTRHRASPTLQQSTRTRASSAQPMYHYSKPTPEIHTHRPQGTITMHTMYKAKSNENYSPVYSPESIRSQPAPTLTLHESVRSQPTPTITLNTVPYTRLQSSASLSLPRNHMQHNNQSHTNNQGPYVYAPKHNKQMNIPDNIGLTDYKEEKQDYKQEYNAPAERLRLRRAETAPTPQQPPPHRNVQPQFNNRMQPNYGYKRNNNMDTQVQQVQYAHGMNNNVLHYPTQSQVSYGYPTPSQGIMYNTMIYNQYSHTQQHSNNDQQSVIPPNNNAMQESDTNSSDSSSSTGSDSDFIESESMSTHSLSGSESSSSSGSSGSYSNSHSSDDNDRESESETDHSDDTKTEITSQITPFIKRNAHLLLIKRKEYDKTTESESLLRSALSSKTQILFDHLDSKMIDEIVAKMYRVDCPKHKCIIRENEMGDAFFVVESGKFVMLRDNRVVGSAKAKSSFGEGSLLYSAPRSATLRAKEDCVVWALDSNEFTKIRRKLSAKRYKRTRKKVKFLQQTSLFKSYDVMDIVDIAEAMKPVLYENRAQIITEYDGNTHFFIICRGTAESSKMVNNASKRVRIYRNFDYFGESGFPTDIRVTATCDNLICYVLNAVESMKYLRKKAVIYSELRVDRVRYGDDDICDINASFLNYGVIGVGFLSEVCLVSNRDDPDVMYALKRMNKNFVINRSESRHIANEVSILSSLNCAFCVSFYGTFADSLHVYVFLEAILGGELSDLLQFNQRFPEKTARFYAACVILAFSEIHCLNVIFRDLSPHNVLVHENGYIKLIDFGLSKMRNDSCTLCGAAEYLAPEMIQSAHQSFTTDWWTLGIFIYEMIVGAVPFGDDHKNKMYEKILTKSVSFPPQNECKISDDAKELITQLLRKHPYKRLGSGLNGAHIIQNHKWFKNLNWNKMRKLQITPPYMPTIANNTDISNFNKCKAPNDRNELLNINQNKDDDEFDDDVDPYAWCDKF